MGRSPCCDKEKVKRGPWSPEEDATLKDYVERYGTGGNWITLPHKAGLKRCGKSCRLRWLNYLRPDIRHGGFTEEEDNIILSLYETMGSRWSVIASQLPGRTDNDVKNYWNTKLRKKLMAAKTENLHPRMSSASVSKARPPSPSASTRSTLSLENRAIGASNSLNSSYNISKLNSLKPQDENLVTPLHMEVGFPYTTESQNSDLDSAPSVFEESAMIENEESRSYSFSQAMTENRDNFQSTPYNSFDASCSWSLNDTEDSFSLMAFPGGFGCELRSNHAVQEKESQIGDYNPGYKFLYANLLLNPDCTQQALYSPSVAPIL